MVNLSQVTMLVALVVPSVHCSLTSTQTTGGVVNIGNLDKRQSNSMSCNDGCVGTNDDANEGFNQGYNDGINFGTDAVPGSDLNEEFQLCFDLGLADFQEGLPPNPNGAFTPQTVNSPSASCPFNNVAFCAQYEIAFAQGYQTGYNGNLLSFCIRGYLAGFASVSPQPSSRRRAKKDRLVNARHNTQW